MDIFMGSHKCFLESNWHNEQSCAEKIVYFGQPFAGRFFWKDFLISSCQLPLSFKTSGSGPRFFCRVGFFMAVFTPEI